MAGKPVHTGFGKEALLLNPGAGGVLNDVGRHEEAEAVDPALCSHVGDLVGGGESLLAEFVVAHEGGDIAAGWPTI